MIIELPTVQYYLFEDKTQKEVYKYIQLNV